jgi:hypothetical protein
VRVKLERTSRLKGEGYQELEVAVNDWLGSCGRFTELPLNGQNLKNYAALVGINYKSLVPYVSADAGKRRKLSGGWGHKNRIISSDVEEFIVAVMRRRDRANDGVSRTEAIDLLQDLLPATPREKLAKAFDVTIRPQHSFELTNIVKAQASTVKRCEITVPQQYRWHAAVDGALDFLRRMNMGTTKDGKTFGEVAPSFVLGGDETCFLASAGDVKIIGDKEKKKHEIPTAGSRSSITVYRCGSAAGVTGPTGFLPPGKNSKTGYTDTFLRTHGAAVGSTIVMTPTGYMTEDAWVEMAPSMCAGIRAMPIICDRPDWWVLKIIDGFGPHTSSLRAMEIYSESKILLLKEEGDTSHVCQAYDQMVAKDDKRSMRACLAYLRASSKITKGVVDGWGLIHVGLAAVRELEPDSWVKSFKRVNLNPHHRVSFADWCVHIESFLVGGQSFKKKSATTT